MREKIGIDEELLNLLLAHPGCTAASAAVHLGIYPSVLYKRARRDPEFRRIISRKERERLKRAAEFVPQLIRTPAGKTPATKFYLPNAFTHAVMINLFRAREKNDFTPVEYLFHLKALLAPARKRSIPCLIRDLVSRYQRERPELNLTYDFELTKLESRADKEKITVELLPSAEYPTTALGPHGSYVLLDCFDLHLPPRLKACYEQHHPRASDSDVGGVLPTIGTAEPGHHSAVSVEAASR